MTLLIVESNPHLAGVWQRHVERYGRSVILARDQKTAVDALRAGGISIVISNVELEKGSAFAVADYASYRCPDVRILFVTSASFFSDGSIFNHVANACACVPASSRPDDIAAMVEHYAART